MNGSKIRMKRLKIVFVVVATGLVAAFVAPALAAIVIPPITAPTLPTIPTFPTIKPGTTIPQPANPPAPPLPNTTTLGNVIQTQLNAIVAAAGLLPGSLQNDVLTTYIPTPDGAVQNLTMTVQQYIDRVANNAIIGNSNTGVLGTPEVAAGSIVHSYGFVRTYKTPPTALLSDIIASLPHYKVTTSPYLAATPSTALVGALTAGYVGTVNAAGCAVLTPPTTTQPTTPVPSSCKITPPVALPVALPAIPAGVPAGTYPPALLPKLPGAVFTHAGGQLINVQGSGWDVRRETADVKETGATTAGAKHTGGNSSIGTNLDTAPRTTVSDPTAAIDPWPIYVPLFTSNTSLGANPSTSTSDSPSDRSIDFLGFASVSDSRHCYKGTTTTSANEITTQAQLDTLKATAPWALLTCTSVGSLSGDGVANFSGWPVNFHDDLSVLWGPAPAVVDTANLAIAAVLGTVPTTSLEIYGLTLVGIYSPYITGKLVPFVQSQAGPLPTTPTTPTVP